MTDSLPALQARWDNYLHSIEKRFDDTIAEAGPACLALLREADYETTPLMVGWQAIKSQCHGLIAQVDNTWRKPVEPAMLVYGYSAPGYDWSTEQNKGIQLAEKLHRELDQADVSILGQCAEVYYDHAMAMLRTEFRCSQCSAPIVIDSNLYRAHYRACEFCSTVNTYQPSTRTQQVEWFVVHHLAQYRCIEQHDAMIEAGNRRSRARHDEDHALLNVEFCRAARAYWERYLQKRISIIPELDRFYEDDLARRLRDGQCGEPEADETANTQTTRGGI